MGTSATITDASAPRNTRIRGDEVEARLSALEAQVALVLQKLDQPLTITLTARRAASSTLKTVGTAKGRHQPRSRWEAQAPKPGAWSREQTPQADEDTKGLISRSAKVEKRVNVQELPEELKRFSLEALVWLTYQDDSEINEREVCELQLLMTEWECNAESRQTVRERIRDPERLDPRVLVKQIRKLAGEAREDISFGLMWHAIRLDRSAASEGQRRHEDGIRRLACLLEVDDGKVALIENECELHERLLRGELSEQGIRRAAKEMAAKAAAVGVPVAAVYAGGSVTGLSAAGITSGLATLGLGGVFGLSSMVTGIGIVAVSGVFAYKGMRWLTSGSRRRKEQHRERLLQEFLLIHRKSLANLAEDIGSLADKLVRWTADTEVNQLRLTKGLSRFLLNFVDGVSRCSDVTRLFLVGQDGERLVRAPV